MRHITESRPQIRILYISMLKTSSHADRLITFRSTQLHAVIQINGHRGEYECCYWLSVNCLRKTSGNITQSNYNELFTKLFSKPLSEIYPNNHFGITTLCI